MARKSNERCAQEQLVPRCDNFELVLDTHVTRVTTPRPMPILRSKTERPFYLRSRLHLYPQFPGEDAGIWDRNITREVKTMTGIAPVMWSVWGGILLLFILVKVYSGRVGRDEESQIFLGDSMQQERSAQAVIAAKVNKVEPVKKAVIALLGMATLWVIGYYLFDIYKQFNP
jgi:hypothetical protein